MIHNLPEPCRYVPRVPNKGWRYYIPDIYSADLYDSFYWVGDSLDKLAMERGLCYESQDDAVTHARALLNLGGVDV